MMKRRLEIASRLSVAPMMDWTDRHCRMLHRALSSEALLYTEMVTSAALVRGGAQHLLEHDAAEHPVALQLGGSDAQELAQAARMGVAAGYAEINLNVGCPSDRVQSGTFGAVLMRDAPRVARCISEMRAAVDAEITVKCRIGVDDQDPEAVLPEFLAQIVAAGCERVIIHARKAWLQGLSPKENRDIPPLDYALVKRMKGLFPNLHISINGGITSLDSALEMLDASLDGVMVGRAAYHQPCDILSTADRRIFGAKPDAAGRTPDRSAEDAVAQMLPYIEAHLSQGGRLHQVTRHMLGLFTGRPGARGWRRTLSERAHDKGAGTEVVEAALQQVTALAQDAAAG